MQDIQDYLKLSESKATEIILSKSKLQYMRCYFGSNAFEAEDWHI